MSMSDRDGVIWYDGELVPWREANTHVLTHTLHYGMGVFEGVRAYNTPDGTAIFRLQAHTDRLFDSAHIFNMQIPFSKEEINQAQRAAVRENGLESAYLRPMVFFGSEGMGLRASGLKVHVIVAAWHWGAYLGADAIIGRWVETGADVSGTGWNAITSLVDAERAGDPRARALVADVVEELGAALGNLINLTNPTKVLIGGWVGERLFTDYESDIDAAIKRHTLRRPVSQYTLAKTRFAGDAVAAGGALLPLEALVLTGWSTSA